MGTNLSQCVFRACRATEANFIQCNLTSADFSGTELTGANFEDSDLSKANFATAVLLATSLGLRVAGHSQEPEPRRPASPRRGRKM